MSCPCCAGCFFVRRSSAILGTPPGERFVDGPLLLKAAVIFLVPVGLFIGIRFFIFAYLRFQAISGKDVAPKMRTARALIALLFTLFVSIFAAVQRLLHR
jgi:hypothetical protein